MTLTGVFLLSFLSFQVKALDNFDVVFFVQGKMLYFISIHIFNLCSLQFHLDWPISDCLEWQSTNGGRCSIKGTQSNLTKTDLKPTHILRISSLDNPWNPNRSTWWQTCTPILQQKSTRIIQTFDWKPDFGLDQWPCQSWWSLVVSCLVQVWVVPEGEPMFM